MYIYIFQIISSSSENELEICVQLIDDNFDRTVLEEQVLMLTDEAVFEFAPLGSKTNTEKILLEVSYFYLSFCSYCSREKTFFDCHLIGVRTNLKGR